MNFIIREFLPLTLQPQPPPSRPLAQIPTYPILCLLHTCKHRPPNLSVHQLPLGSTSLLKQLHPTVLQIQLPPLPFTRLFSTWAWQATAVAGKKIMRPALRTFALNAFMIINQKRTSTQHFLEISLRFCPTPSLRSFSRNDFTSFFPNRSL